MDSMVPFWRKSVNTTGWFYVNAITSKIFKPQVGWPWNDDVFELLSAIDENDWRLSTLAFTDDQELIQMTAIAFKYENDAIMFKMRFG